MRLAKQLSWAAGFAAMVVAGASAQAEMKIKLEPFITGINTPLAMEQAPDGRFFIIEQFGQVRIASADGELQAEPFLDVRNRIPRLWKDFDEKGLLGLALHPNFENNGKVYVAYSGHLDFQGDLAKEFWWSHTNTVAEYTVSNDDPDVADKGTERIVSRIDWPQFNHNGHWIGFGPDGMLYISTGDGGYANDWGIGHNPEHGNGQDMLTPLGKILRINADTGEAPADNPYVGDDNALPEIWAHGLRNPWRCSFDTGSGALFCGDVQQNSYEEITVVEKGTNHGWRRMEVVEAVRRFHPDDHPKSCDQSGLTMPILEYNNCTAKPDGCLGISITGGYVYQGAHEAWKGKYIFGDWSKSFGAMDGQIFFGTKGADGSWTMEKATTNMEGNNPYILAFAQDSAGEVYALTSITTGPVGTLDTIYKIVPADM